MFSNVKLVIRLLLLMGNGVKQAGLADLVNDRRMN